MDAPDLDSARHKAMDREMRAGADRASATPIAYTDASGLPPYLRRLHTAEMRAYRDAPVPEPVRADRKVRRFTAGT